MSAADLLREGDAIRLEGISFTYPEAERPVFEGLDLGFSPGFSCLVGPNGSGKSTAMLLASGRIAPSAGRVSVLGRDAATIASEEERNLLCSVVYQNMEFETDEPLGALLEYVLISGARHDKDEAAVGEVVRAFGLGAELGKKPQELSKGAHQRFILALSLLYGSPALMLDEPVFALAEAEKEAALSFIRAFARERGILVVASLHELDLTLKHSDEVILLGESGPVARGPSPTILSDRDLLERAYGVPYALLRQKESLKRDMLKAMVGLN